MFMAIVALPFLLTPDGAVETRLCGKKTCLHLGQINFPFPDQAIPSHN